MSIGADRHRNLAESLPIGDDELAARLEEWIGDLRALADRGEFLFSVNDYAVLMRKSPG